MSQVKYCIQVCCVALAIIFASILAEPVNIALSWTFGVRCVFCSPAWAHDDGQFENNAVTEWYRSLMQPDVPNASCCGEADAYWADEIHVRGGRTYATITDDREDAPRHRPHIDNGTEFEIPNNKLKWDRSNPTGHGVIFLSRQGYVYCFVQPGGV